MMQKNNLKITALCPEHVHQMAEIEKLCFSEPWSEDTIRDELDTPLSRYFVCLDGDRVLGYIGTRILLDQCDITNIAVHPDARRGGIATLLLEELERTVDDIRRRFGHFSVNRAIALLDPTLTNLDARSEHVIHPVGFFKAL